MTTDDLPITLTEEQELMFKALKTPLKQNSVLAFIEQGYENQSLAYRTACKRINKKPAAAPDSAASAIFRCPKAKRFLASIQATNAAATATNAQYVLTRLREIDELDVLDIFKDDLSGLKPLTEWPSAWRRSINGINIKRVIDGDLTAVIEKIKMPDKLKNLETIGRHVGVKAFIDEVKDDSGDMAKALEILAGKLPGA